jgi:hypothetical protein
MPTAPRRSRPANLDLTLDDGGSLARRATGFLPDGAYYFQDDLDLKGPLSAPVLLGEGIPLFHALPRQVNLALIESKTLKNSCVLLTYHVKRSRAPNARLSSEAA